MFKFQNKISLACVIFWGTAKLSAMQFNGMDLDRDLLASNDYQIAIDFSAQSPKNLTFIIENNDIRCGVMETPFQEKATEITGKYSQIVAENINRNGIMLVTSINLNKEQVNCGLQFARKSIKITAKTTQDQLSLLLAPQVEIKTEKINGLYFIGGDYYHENLKAKIGGKLGQFTLAINEAVKTPNHILESVTFYKINDSTTDYSFFGNFSMDFSNLENSSVFIVGADRAMFKFNKEAFNK